MFDFILGIIIGYVIGSFVGAVTQIRSDNNKK